METTFIAGGDKNGKLTRQELALVPSPQSTATHQVIPHVEIVNSLEEALGFRHISITSEEFAVTKDGKNFFGVLGASSLVRALARSAVVPMPKRAVPESTVTISGLGWVCGGI